MLNFSYGLSSSSLHCSLSAILFTGFMLNLRQRNSAAIAINSISLPPIQTVHDVVERLHQTFMVEMGDHESNDPENDVRFLNNIAASPSP